MTTIFSTTKGSLQLLQSALSPGKANSFPKVILISLSAILSQELCSSPVILNFILLCVLPGKKWKTRGQAGLSGCVKIESDRSYNNKTSIIQHL